MAPRIPDDLLARHHVLVGSDNAFQRRARRLQALWREERQLAVGMHRGKPLGSRIAATLARDTLANFLSDGIRDVVRHAVLGAGRAAGQLIAEDRLFSNLLSSQPLCFNLFGEAARDVDLATQMFSRLLPERVARVVEISFEHSPGRGDSRFTGDRSAFDVFVRCVSPAGKRGFVGIEVKYHEALGDPAASHKARYDEVAVEMGCFVDARDALRAAPLQQLWRDHLLVGALLAHSTEYDEGAFLFLAPQDNLACRGAVAKYREHLTNDTAFVARTLEDVVRPFEGRADAAWCSNLVDRYLAFDRVDACVAQAASAQRP